MELKVNRLYDNGKATIGYLSIDGGFQCFTLEDEYRDVKVAGETRIPEGTYEIGLRTEGGFHGRYSKRFNWHKGMLHVLNVPNFKWILIHIGNDEDDTAGCLLVGETCDINGFVGRSGAAYKDVYLKVIAAIEKGEKVIITYK